jgi:hypothetical protein
VCHYHAPPIMPFAISGVPLIPVFHLGAAMGPRAVLGRPRRIRRRRKIELADLKDEHWCLAPVGSTTASSSAFQAMRSCRPLPALQHPQAGEKFFAAVTLLSPWCATQIPTLEISMAPSPGRTRLTPHHECGRARLSEKSRPSQDERGQPPQSLERLGHISGENISRGGHLLSPW